MRLKPRPLRPGATISVVAPCSPFRPDNLWKGIEWLRHQGYQVRYREDIVEGWRYLAGTDERRQAELAQALLDPATDAIICARGGYGASRLVTALAALNPPPRPVLFVGFSDVTMLHLWLGQSWNWVTVHGPMVGTTWAGQGLEPETAASFLRLLQDATVPSPVAGSSVLMEGSAEGLLVGGNLSLLAHSVGTPWQADFTDSIVLLEDIGEAPYRIDRMLTQLLLAGTLERARAIVLGEWTDCDPPADADFTVEDVLRERLAPLGIPILAGLPIGHGERNVSVPLGIRARIDTANARLEFLEPATQP